jgi:hypothetical protein
MNQAQRNEHIQHARAELRAGRPVLCWWPTPGTRGEHVTRVMLSEIHHFAQHMVPLDSVMFVWQMPAPEPVRMLKVEHPPEPELTPGAKAEAFLLATLTPDAMPALEVQRLADAVGIKPRTLRRTRERMKIRVFKKGREARYWELPGTED